MSKQEKKDLKARYRAAQEAEQRAAQRVSESAQRKREIVAKLNGLQEQLRLASSELEGEIQAHVLLQQDRIALMESLKLDKTRGSKLL